MNIAAREALSRVYIPPGQGIEIGALHAPLPVPPLSRVIYVDRLPLQALRDHYPELAHLTFVTPHVIDDGESLSSIGSGTQDFVIANHFIEHAEDPIGCLKTFYRVLKPGGVIYLSVPDKRRIFDKKRPLTAIRHLEADHRDGVVTSRLAHYAEWASLVLDKEGDDIPRYAERLLRQRYSIHFHCWTFASFALFLAHVLSNHVTAMELLYKRCFDFEGIFILRSKPGAKPRQASAIGTR